MITDGHRTGSRNPQSHAHQFEALLCPPKAASYRDGGRLEALPGSPLHMTAQYTQSPERCHFSPTEENQLSRELRNTLSSLGNIVDKAGKVQSTVRQVTSINSILVFAQYRSSKACRLTVVTRARGEISYDDSGSSSRLGSFTSVLERCV